MILIIVGILLFLGLLFGIGYFYSQQKLEDFEIKLEEAEKNMDIFLEKKIELLSRLMTHLKKKKINQELPDIEEYKANKLERRTLQFRLFDTYTEVIQLVDENEEKLSDKKSISFLDQLSDNEDDLIACVKYYNDSATDYNYYLHRFPISLMRHLLHKNQVELYRNEKRETFEILKEK